MDCGHEWIVTSDGSCRCPKCGVRLQVKDTKERVLKQKSYFNVITTKSDNQVIRSFALICEMRKGYQAKYSSIAICEYWIDEKGKTAIMGLCRAMNSYFYDLRVSQEYLKYAVEVGETSLFTEPGVLTMYAMQEKSDSCKITILEIYASQEAYQKHIQSDHFQKYKQGILHMVKSLELCDQTPLNEHSILTKTIE